MKPLHHYNSADIADLTRQRSSVYIESCTASQATREVRRQEREYDKRYELLTGFPWGWFAGLVFALIVVFALVSPASGWMDYPALEIEACLVAGC